MLEGTNTRMMWQEIDKQIDIVTTAQWAIKHFQLKYGADVVAIGCHQKVESALVQSFPDLQVHVDEHIYHPSILYLYGLVEESEDDLREG